MKIKETLIVAYALSAGAAFAQEEVPLGQLTIEMRPTEKRYLTLKPNERNPYSKRIEVERKSDADEQNAEEREIHSKLASLTVSGRSRSYNGMRLLLGDILVERGMVLPQLISNQTQQLKVVDVAEDKIVLGWLDVESGELTGKTMPIPYNVDPVVRYVLQGQTGSSDGTKKGVQMGVLRPNRETQTPAFLKP